MAALVKRAVDNDAFWLYAAKTWYGLYYDWIPAQSGELADNVSFAPGVITHNAPYAAQVYYRGKAAAPERGRHPLGSALWDEAAAPTQLPKLQAALQKYLDERMAAV